ncbi:MAG: dethiobiotin synthase [Oxalobacteraceae bacterium]|jgi:dethiobiotin synthetase|nr:dethiobiotin synthase [Oxalobacteraceae bacterium]
MSLRFSCFVTGTDTGVGKTLISAAMLNALGRLGLQAVGMKPVAAGTLVRDGQTWNEDVALLAEQSTLAVDATLTTSYLLNEPCAPHVAARLEDVTIAPAVLRQAYQQVSAQAEAVVVEGVGGFRVPLTDDFDTADFAVELGLDVILVVGLRLGCLNHALLTAEAIAARGLRLTGWIANQIDPEMPHQADNVQALQQRLSAPLLGVVPWMSVAAPARAADAIDFSFLDSWPRSSR